MGSVFVLHGFKYIYVLVLLQVADPVGESSTAGKLSLKTKFSFFSKLKNTGLCNTLFYLYLYMAYQIFLGLFWGDVKIPSL